MKNIFRVFLLDAKRLASNVVAIVIVMGLGIIPALYAWFNIMSNWDPYGQDATSQMNIAVYSEDLGYTYGDVTINVGDTIVDGLKENKTIGWVFSDSREAAMKGVYNGDYYAAFIIPADFTENLLSVLGSEVENPTITYYENSKKNAIATKITSKVKTTVQNQVNTSIVSTLTEVATKSGEVLTGDSDEDNGIVSQTKAKLEEMDDSLTTYASLLNTMGLLTDSTSNLVDSSQALIPNAQNLVDGSQSTITSLQDSVLAGAQTADTIKSMVDISLDQIDRSLENLDSQLAILQSTTSSGSLSTSLKTVSSLMKSTLETLKGVDGVSDLEEYTKTVAAFETLSKDVDTFAADQATTEADFKALQESVSAEVKTCREAIKSLKTKFDYQVAPGLSTSVYEVESALISSQNLLSSLDSDFPEINLILQEYKDTLSSGSGNISDTRDQVLGVQENLEKLIDGLEGLSGNEQYQQILKILESDPALIAEFVASPITMEEEALFEIETYGSAMAPFYTVLALWVGGLIMVALIHVKVKDAPELEGVKTWQKFFGRYITFFLIGQAQTLVTVLGNLFYIKIQCPHPFLFWLAASVMSTMFTLFMYSLTVAWGNVGEAIAVVVMVIQVAGAGGTFPVEVLPMVYQAIYKFLPFTYAMNALRECVGGLYHLYYLNDVLVLVAYILVSLFIGLVLRKPFEKLNAMIEKSKEKSGLMI